MDWLLNCKQNHDWDQLLKKRNNPFGNFVKMKITLGPVISTGKNMQRYISIYIYIFSTIGANE
jgi:hypothetical protein